MEILCSWVEVKQFSALRGANLQYVAVNGYYHIAASDGPMTVYCKIPLSLDPLPDSEQKDFETNYRAGCNKILSVERPFADPLFRTKIKACDSVISVSPGDTGICDVKLTEDLYLYGGSVIVQNPFFGDFITACVYDKESVIPEPYRATLAENWPVIASYVDKKFIEIPHEGMTASDTLDTRPLIAKITAGLYLRTIYHATNAGIPRLFVTNYNLLKKL